MSDRKLFFAIVALYTISLIFVYSLSAFTILYYGYDNFHFLLRQSVAVIIGIFIMYYLSWLDPDRWFVPIGFTLLIFSFVAMLIMPLMPESMVKSVLGARRWIHIGPVSIAPVEFFKPAFVFFMAWSFTRKIIHHGKMSLIEEFEIIMPYVVFFIISAVLIAVVQNDMGQVVVLAATLFIMMIFAGRSIKLFMVVIFTGLIGGVVLILSAPHRINRLKDWWSMIQDSVLSIFPENIASALRVNVPTEPYQIANSLNAFCNGGFTGQGLGGGQFKLGYLSEVHTDFILAGITEELGYIGLFVVVLLFVYIIWRLVIIAGGVKNPMYHLYVVGITLIIIFAFVVNSYGISGLTPIKGIAVPFLSYGGSQILASSIAMGLILMVSKKRRRE